MLGIMFKSFGIRDRLLAAEAYRLAFSLVVAELSLNLPIFAFAKRACFSSFLMVSIP